MSKTSKWTLSCPDCGSELVVDASTGQILHHEKPEVPPKDFDALFSELDHSKARAGEVFDREFSAFHDRDRILEEKFEEAMKRADEADDGKPPVRPWDLD